MIHFWHSVIRVLVSVAEYFTGTNKDTGASPERSDSEPSASSTSVTGNNYYIFLSFRGPDTRNGFVDHLYHKLRDVGLRFHPNFVFRDDNDLPFGEEIGDNLISAIKHSKVSIPIISEKYAASEWCLRELIEIMECKKNSGQIVLPVFYNVKPYEVRELLGAFGEAFKSRMHRFTKEDVKQKGPAALRELVDSRVFESEKTTSGREGELVNKLVDIIMDKMQRDFSPSLPGDLVGFDDHVAKVMRLADTAPSKVQPIVIFGIGGVGKTTLAMDIYKKLSYDFEFRSFLKDIRETIKSKGMEHVQSLLISDLTKSPAATVRDSERGINMIRISCANKKVLLLLDDVECQENLNKLIGDCHFGSGSKIIITCREKADLNSTYRMYELPPMNHKDSLLLFNKYAFEGKQRSREYVALSGDIVDTTGRLPLALVIVASLLKGKSTSIWKETLEKLRMVSNKDVRNMLKISYNSLGYEEQQMFLDIACFFIGIDRRIPTYLWEDLKFFPSTNLEALINRSSITVDDNNKLRMHDQLKDLGRAITRPAGKKPWDCSRLWDEEAVTVQLSEDENRNIEALRLDKSGSRNFIERKRFKKMPFLNFLRLSEVDLDEDLEGSLSELRWLEWKMCCDSSKATHVPAVKLLILDLSGGYISHEWRGWGGLMKMERLKVLNLSWCSKLKRTPDLSAFGNLEMLILENCENLQEVHPTIRNVKRLVSLNLRHCGSLEELPEDLKELKELEELIVDETDIQKIPSFIGSLKKLKTLSAVGCRLLTGVDSSISGLVRLSTLNLNSCMKLQELPDSMEALGELQRLSLERCYMVEEIPTLNGALVELDLSSTRIKELPDSIGELNKLTILRICHSQIEKLPSALGKLKSLQELDASGCHKLKGEILLDKGGLSSLSTLRLGSAKFSAFGSPAVPKLPLWSRWILPAVLKARQAIQILSSWTEDSGELSTLKLHELHTLDHLDLLYCSELQSLPKPPSSLSCLQLTCRSEELPSLSHLNHLKKLTLHSCMSLKSIPELPSCIRELRVCKCPKLKSLPNLSKLESLSELELLQCYGLNELKGLEALKSLRKLDVSRSTDLSNLNDFEDLESLRNSDMQCYDRETDNLRTIPSLGQLKSLEVLNTSARKHIKLLDLSKSEHLKQLIVNNCQNLVEIRFHDKIEPLERFDRDGCQPEITGLFST